MKKIQFYMCPKCGSVLTSPNHTEMSCCGKQLEPLPDSHQTIKYIIKEINGECFIQFDHAMTKDDYISFVAYVAYDRYLLVQLNPGQDAIVRLPKIKDGKLYCYGVKEGLVRLK